MTWPNGVMYMVNSTGPNTEPWGTPYFNTVGWDALPPANTVWLRSVKYDSSHRSTTPDMPKVSLSLFSSILWSSVLNAADRSRSTEWKQILDHRPWAGHLWLSITRLQCYGLLCMLTEMSQVYLSHSAGQTAVERQLFQESLKGSVGWKQGDSF